MQVLEETGAGKQIRKLSKHEHSSIKAAAIQVIETWKETIRKQAKELTPALPSGSQPGPSASAAKPPTTDAASQPEDDAPRQKRSPFVRTKPTGDKSRDHVRLSFSEALLLAVVDDEEGVSV